jgi:hypothetical protein
MDWNRAAGRALAWLHSPRPVRWAVALLLLPLLISPVGDLPAVGRLPMVRGGDEPHYLVMVNSLVLDGDLDLSNNYQRVHDGKLDAGRGFKGAALDHHTVWVREGRRLPWAEIFVVPHQGWQRDANGHPVPTPRAGADTSLAQPPEYGAHPPGLALLLAPLVWPLRDSAFLEPAVLLLAVLATVLAFFLLRRLLGHLGARPFAVNVVSLLAFLGTPAWFHGRTLFCEPWLLLFAVGSHALVLTGGSAWVAGLLLGAGALMKPPFLVVAVPLAVVLVQRRAWGGLVALGLPSALSVAALLALHAHMYGSPWEAPQPFAFGHPLAGAWGLMTSLEHGILPFAPVLALALWGWGRLLRSRPAPGLLAVGVAFLLYYAVMSCWHAWDGGWCYGPRLVVPVLPFLAVGLLGVVDRVEEGNRRWTWALGLAGVLSVAIQVVSVVLYWKTWDLHPLAVVAALLSGGGK